MKVHVTENIQRGSPEFFCHIFVSLFHIIRSESESIILREQIWKIMQNKKNRKKNSLCLKIYLLCSYIKAYIYCALSWDNTCPLIELVQSIFPFLLITLEVTSYNGRSTQMQISFSSTSINTFGGYRQATIY